MFVSFISIIVNQSSITAALYSQRGFIFIFCFFFLSKSGYHQVSLNKIYVFTIKIGLISSLFTLLQRIYVFISGKTGDMVTGLFSADSQHSYFHVFCMIIILSHWLNNEDLLKKISNKILIFIFIFSVAIANNNAVFGYIFFCILIFGFFSGFNKLFALFGRSIFIVIILWPALMIVDFFQPKLAEEKGSYSYITNIDYIETYLFGSKTSKNRIFEKDGSLKRGSALIFGFDLINKKTSTLLFGKGAGSTSDSSLKFAKGYLHQKYAGYKIGRTTLSGFLTEVGIIGIFAFSLFLVSIFLSNSGEFSSSTDKIIRRATILFIIAYSPYENMFLTLVNGYILLVLLYPNFSVRNEN